jgi:hypothetical protein
VARSLLSGAAMTYREQGAGFVLLCALVVACNSGSRTDENVNRDEACRDARNAREDVLLVIDVDGGAEAEAGADAEAPCVTNCPGVVPDASFSDPASCQAQCMERASAQGLNDPKFVGCRASAVSIACTFDVLAPKPCDLVTR